ncbi:Translation initiation factor 3 (EIF-3) [Blastocystis hominis]|uniref:Translation initiation factor 3 (EIF-3) n=1 Tax=Blastocystis hominis TaxID=12968 RepID=D8M3D2_BLAHO|nr:Translation initiation factor 3 (EIF-3) [Blastocystis hominis]CBK22405.2 Translation initiation factor 3 (EIF-3) [Blastocystis hominis]|eukprot:XP_012896453.1 Translation initiation factor 3 (EIF-3) [Blastocystis hominis]
MGNQLIKTTRRSRVMKITKSVPRRVYERMQIVPFGLPSGGNEGVTIQSQDQIYFEKPSEQEKVEKPAETRKSTFVCRICKGNHLAANCPNRGQEEPTPSAAVYQPKQAAKSDRYVPPNQRERSSGQEEDDQFIVRINNVADDVDEKKLYSMLNWNYSLRRVHIPKSYDTNKPRGYAFAYFHDKESAEEVIRRYDGYALNHLILEVKMWEKKAGGRTYRTGYGRALPQNAKR